MPWVRFEPGTGTVTETEREVFLRSLKKVSKNDTPLSSEIAIFDSVAEHTDTQNLKPGPKSDTKMLRGSANEKVKP